MNADQEAILILPLESCAGIQDISASAMHVNASMSTYRYTTGPMGEVGGSVQFTATIGQDRNDTLNNSHTDNGYFYVHYSDILDAQFFMSIFFHIRLDEARMNGTKYVLAYGDEPSNYGFQIKIESDRLKFVIGNRSDGNLGLPVESPKLERRQWYHVGLVYDYMSGEATLYIDGRNEANQTFNPKMKIQTDGGHLHIGHQPDSRMTFLGQLHCLKLYNRVVLSSEISNVQDCPSGLSLLWHLSIFTTKDHTTSSSISGETKTFMNLIHNPSFLFQVHQIQVRHFPLVSSSCFLSFHIRRMNTKNTNTQYCFAWDLLLIANSSLRFLMMDNFPCCKVIMLHSSLQLRCQILQKNPQSGLRGFREKVTPAAVKMLQTLL